LICCSLRDHARALLVRAGAAAALVLVLLLIMEAAKLEAASKRAEGERQLKVD
jgi:hypothetical protein